MSALNYLTLHYLDRQHCGPFTKLFVDKFLYYMLFDLMAYWKTETI